MQHVMTILGDSSDDIHALVRDQVAPVAQHVNDAESQVLRSCHCWRLIKVQQCQGPLSCLESIRRNLELVGVVRRNTKTIIFDDSSCIWLTVRSVSMSNSVVSEAWMSWRWRPMTVWSSSVSESKSISKHVWVGDDERGGGGENKTNGTFQTGKVTVRHRGTVQRILGVEI